MTITAATQATAAAVDQPETLLQAIARTYYDLLPHFEQYVGMTKARWQILSQLSRAGELSQAALQQLLHVDGAAITRQVKQLEEDGLIQRRADPRDNRFTLVTLSEAGRQLAAGMVGKRESFDLLVTAGLSDEEIAVMRRCLGQIRANMAALRDRG